MLDETSVPEENHRPTPKSTGNSFNLPRMGLEPRTANHIKLITIPDFRKFNHLQVGHLSINIVKVDGADVIEIGREFASLIEKFTISV